MNHKLDNHPISERMIYVNDLQLANDVPYETERELEAAATGNREMEGGILLDDNVRIFVPMDLNADAIMRQLYMLYDALGPVDEGNECNYSSSLARIILQLEVMIRRGLQWKQEMIIRQLLRGTVCRESSWQSG